MNITSFFAQVQTPTIPLTAWEQAVIVVVFGLFVLGLLYLLYKIAIILYKIVQDTNKSFQEAILLRDKQWQEFLKELRQDYKTEQVELAKLFKEEQQEREKAFLERNRDIVEALQQLIERVKLHDDYTRSVGNILMTQSKTEPRSRPKQ